MPDYCLLVHRMKTNCAVYCRTFSWFDAALYIQLLTNVLCVLFNDAVIVLRLYSNGDIRISMEHWWNDAYRGNRNSRGGGAVHHKPYVDWPGTGHGLAR
jgi:hypothetical protein